MKDNAGEIGPLPGLASRDAGAGGEIALDCAVDCKYPYKHKVVMFRAPKQV